MRLKGLEPTRLSTQEPKGSVTFVKEAVVVCRGTVDESVKNDIAIAERLRTATTLDGTGCPWRRCGWWVRCRDCGMLFRTKYMDKAKTPALFAPEFSYGSKLYSSNKGD